MPTVELYEPVTREDIAEHIDSLATQPDGSALDGDANDSNTPKGQAVDALYGSVLAHRSYRNSLDPLDQARLVNVPVLTSPDDDSGDSTDSEKAAPKRTTRRKARS